MPHDTPTGTLSEGLRARSVDLLVFLVPIVFVLPFLYELCLFASEFVQWYQREENTLLAVFYLVLASAALSIFLFFVYALITRDEATIIRVGNLCMPVFVLVWPLGMGCWTAYLSWDARDRDDGGQSVAGFAICSVTCFVFFGWASRALAADNNRRKEYGTDAAAASMDRAGYDKASKKDVAKA